MELVSVVIPTCDRNTYLIEAVQCVLNQARPADEIIVVNNGCKPLPAQLLPMSVIMKWNHISESREQETKGRQLPKMTI